MPDAAVDSATTAAIAARTRPDIAIMLSGLHRMAGPDAREYITAAQHVEALGFDEFLVADHVVLGGDLDSYPYGEFAWGTAVRPEEPWPETLTLLAAIAVATERMRIGPGVLIVPLRPAVLLAKTVATIDQLSAGRFTFGVGTGWLRKEFEALDVPFADRWQRTADTLRACRTLWSEMPAAIESHTVSFHGVYCSPQPQHRIPIWLGAAMNEARAEWLAEVGDGWFPINPDPTLVQRGLTMIRGAYARRGRDASELGVRVWTAAVRSSTGGLDVNATIDHLRPALASGVNSLWFPISAHLGLETSAAVSQYVEELAALLDADWN
jgi:probable F420-dependent oxidoreductase